jgi:hypothetical protein
MNKQGRLSPIALNSRARFYEIDWGGSRVGSPIGRPIGGLCPRFAPRPSVICGNSADSNLPILPDDAPWCLTVPSGCLPNTYDSLTLSVLPSAPQCHQDQRAAAGLFARWRGRRSGWVASARSTGGPLNAVGPPATSGLPGTVHALANLVAAAVPIADQSLVLNHWRQTAAAPGLPRVPGFPW